MSWIQQLEEEQYDTQTEWLNVMRAEAVDHFADEQQYYCEEHDYMDYDNECPHGHEPAPEPLRTYLPEYEPPF